MDTRGPATGVRGECAHASSRRWDEEWRWEPGRHLTPTSATITVLEPSSDAIGEREKRIAAGARVVPFGFARAPAGPEPTRNVDPLTWDGDQG